MKSWSPREKTSSAGRNWSTAKGGELLMTRACGCEEEVEVEVEEEEEEEEVEEDALVGGGECRGT